MRAFACAMDPRPCLNCNSTFQPKRSSQSHCSRSCNAQYLHKTGKIGARPKKGVICKCFHCEQEFYVPAYRAQLAKYCSRKCLALDKPEVGQKARDNSPIMRRARALKNKNIPARRYKTIVVNGKQVREHRWIMEQHLERKLEPWEHVHHIDGNYLNNNINNLEVLSNADHQRKELSEWSDKNYLID